ncbi:MAG: TRAP transporter substrate-binding protein [Pseudomonadota bacterium]
MRRVFAVGSLVPLTLFLLITWAVPLQVQAEDVVKLRYSNLFPAPHPNSKLSEAWAKEVEKRTNGKVKISYFPGNTLTPPTQTYDSVVKGIADIGQSLAAYSAGRFLLTEVVAQPLGYTSGYQATKTCNEYYKALKPKEFDDTKVMYIHGHGPGLVQTRKVVTNLGEIKGLRIKANTENAPIVTALGGAPVALPITETYDAVQKGLVDGLLLPYEALKGWKFADVIKAVVVNHSMSYTAPIFVVMNKDKWNSLPKDVQDTIEKINEEWVEKQGKLWNTLDQEAKEHSLQKGIKITEATKEQQAEVAEKMKPVLKEWVEKTKAKGLPAQEALDFCVKYIKEHP